jgi:hypothetical protein
VKIERITLRALVDQLRKTRKARSIVYHCGYLPVDRAADEQLDRVAMFLMALSDLGKISLTCRKVGDGQYFYLAKVIEGVKGSDVHGARVLASQMFEQREKYNGRAYRQRST